MILGEKRTLPIMGLPTILPTPMIADYGITNTKN